MHATVFDTFFLATSDAMETFDH